MCLPIDLLSTGPDEVGFRLWIRLEFMLLGECWECKRTCLLCSSPLSTHISLQSKLHSQDHKENGWMNHPTNLCLDWFGHRVVSMSEDPSKWFFVG